jgi:hypothetical protein
MADRWLKMGEACRLAGMSKPTMRKYCESGDIEAGQHGTRKDWRISQKSLLTFIGQSDDFLLEHLKGLNV